MLKICKKHFLKKRLKMYRNAHVFKTPVNKKNSPCFEKMQKKIKKKKGKII